MSYLSELDPSGFEQRNTEDLLSDRAPAEDKPGFFSGALKAPVMGAIRGFTNLNDLMLTATDLIYPMTDEERDIQENIRKSATDFWTPNAKTVGTAGRVLGGVTEGVAPLVVPLAGPALTVGSNTLAAGKRQVDAGVDARTAGESAAIEGAATYAGLKLPILGGTLGKRLATGAAGNLALGAGSAEAQRLLLEARGYEEMAKNYDPMDGEARAVDLLSGLVFGGLHHLATPSEKAAVATVNDAKHFEKDTAPGIPADPLSTSAHVRAMETATEQLVRGEPVNVDPSVTEAAFHPRPDAGNAVPEELLALDAAREAASVESAANAEAAGYDVAEGVMTDEQLAAFKGLRSDVSADENVGGAREGAPAESGNSSDGGSRGEPLRVYRGAARELTPKDFRPESLGFSTEHPSSGLGVFFTNTAEHAAQYGAVSEHYLDIRNPKVIPVEDFPGLDSLAEYRDLAKQLRKEGHDGVVIDASHLGGPVNYVAFKPEQVKAAGKSSASSDVRLQDPQTRAKLEQLRGSIGLAERGGRLTRDAEGNVTGRTAHAGEPIWMNRPGASEGKGITAKSAMAALDRLKENKPLGAKQQEFVRYALDEFDQVRAATEDHVNDAAAAARDEDPEVAAVREMLASDDIPIPTGEVDAEGNAVTMSAREAMAAADAEVAAAEETGKGIAAAVSCFLTRGA